MEKSFPSKLPSKTTTRQVFCEFFSVLLIQCDEKWTITGVNNGFSEYVGLPHEKIIGRSFLDLLTIDARNSFIEAVSPLHPANAPFLLHLALNGDNPRPMRVLYEHGDGSWILAGEPLFHEEKRFQREMVELNNQLANLTRENARKKRQLSIALRELKEAQSMLVHREKMASLGQMTAGIAHEINNPVSFVLNNQVVLGRDFSDVLSFIDFIEGIKPEIASSLPGILEKILVKEEEVDIRYLAETIPKKIQAALVLTDQRMPKMLGYELLSRAA
jgi:signal transduction histidine kinase